MALVHLAQRLVGAPPAVLGIALVGVEAVDVEAGDVGVDIDADESWYLNIDVKYIQMSTDAKLLLSGGVVLDTLKVDIDPWVPGIGFGYRF